MDFATIYVDFMKDRSPDLYRELSRKGVLHAHAQQRAREASLRLDAFIEANGFQNDLNGRRMVEEIVLHEMLDEITPNEDKPSPAVQAQWEAFVSGTRVINILDEEAEPDELLEQEDEVEPLAGMTPLGARPAEVAPVEMPRLPADFGKNNKVYTEEKMLAARERLRAKLNQPSNYMKDEGGSLDRESL